jgi:hypothetical protein
MSVIKDRITLNFYEEIENDSNLIDFLNSKYNKKFRGQKVKEMIIDFLKNNDDYKEFINKGKEVIKEKEIADAEVSVAKKKLIKGMNTY